MSHVIKFQSPFEKLKTNASCPEVSLRRAIILQAIIDASNTSNNKELKRYELEAKAWIFGNSAYFIKTCQEAGIEPDFVIKITKEVINLQKEKINNTPRMEIIKKQTTDLYKEVVQTL